MAKVKEGKALRTRRAAVALVAVLALGAGALFWTAPADTTADPDGGSAAREAPAAGVGPREGPGPRAGGGEPSGPTLVQSATDSRSPSIVGDGPGVGPEQVAGRSGALGQSATDSRSPTLD